MPSKGRPVPKILYKYRQWESASVYHKKVLTEQELYLSSPDQFNDPFDAGLPLLFYKEQLNDPATIFLKISEEFRIKHPNKSEQEIHSIAFAHQNSDWFASGRYWKEKHAGIRNEISNNVGILSLSSRCDSLVMWGHYASSYTGFCVGFDSVSLQKLFSTSIDKVRYEKAFPRFDIFARNAANEFTRYLSTKSKDWGYEKEYRIIKTGAARQSFKFGSAMIKEIILGYQMDEKSKKEIIALSKNFPEVKIFQSHISNEEFKVYKVPILQ